MFLRRDMMPWSSMGDLRGAATCDQALNVVVAQLLTIALRVMSWRKAQDQTATLPIPHHYQTWPMIEAELQSHGSCRRMKCYVCAKSAMLVGGRAFPVGTKFADDEKNHDAARSRCCGWQRAHTELAWDGCQFLTRFM